MSDKVYFNIVTLVQSQSLEDYCHSYGETSLKLSLHDACDYVDVTLYQQAIGCLIYVCITRQDI